MQYFLSKTQAVFFFFYKLFFWNYSEKPLAYTIPKPVFKGVNPKIKSYDYVVHIFLYKLKRRATYVVSSVRFRLRFLKQAVIKVTTRFRPKDISKFFFIKRITLLRTKPVFYFLRKSKLFNKGRYSRNRQTYRTGAYWCFWVNILAVTGFYYWFYRFSMNFGYLWPFFSLFVISFIFPRALKYNYFFFKNLAQSVLKLFNWFFLLFSALTPVLTNFSKNLFLFLELQKKKESASYFQGFFVLFIESWYKFIFQTLYFLFISLKNVFFFFDLTLQDKFDLYLKKYSYWNYFLPLRWIHSDHRSFFYYRVLHIILDSKLHS